MKCPICKASAADAFHTRYVTVAKCSGADCGHLFATNVLSGAGVQINRDPSDSTSFEERNTRLLRRLHSEGLVVDGYRILDFGSGAGQLARSIRRTFPKAEVCCIEAADLSRKALIASGLQAWASVEEATRRDFDLILMVEVLEHVDDPIGTLSSLRERLRTHGKLFVTTPCGETRSGSRATNAYDTPEHIHFFTERSLQIAIKEAGFGPFQFRVLKEMYPRPSGLRRVAWGLKNMLRPIRAKLQGHHHLVGFTSR